MRIRALAHKYCSMLYGVVMCTVMTWYLSNMYRNNKLREVESSKVVYLLPHKYNRHSLFTPKCTLLTSTVDTIYLRLGTRLLHLDMLQDTHTLPYLKENIMHRLFTHKQNMCVLHEECVNCLHTSRMCMQTVYTSRKCTLHDV